MACDFIHEGHLNIINKAKKYGEVVIGLLTDSAISKYKPLPVFKYKHRFKIVSALKDVKKVIKVIDWDYKSALNDLKPDFIIHGDDWKKTNHKQARKNIIAQIKKWNCKLIEVPYTKSISSSQIKDVLKKDISAQIIKNSSFKQMLNSKPLVRIIEVHNGLTALIAEKTKYKDKQFDGMWLSSLTHSASKGKPDIEYIDDTTVGQTLVDIFDVSTKPLILDADSGGKVDHFRLMLSNLNRLGVSAVIIEDKIGDKTNSLSKNSNKQSQDSIKNFCFKISEGKKTLSHSNMLLIARIESLIVGKSVDEAIKRAKKYIESGADGIMIHSNKKSPKEIFDFCKMYNLIKNKKPLVVVPSTYNSVYEKQLVSNNVSIVIYANQLIRSAFPAMVATATSILKHGRSMEADNSMMPISEIVELIPNKNG